MEFAIVRKSGPKKTIRLLDETRLCGQLPKR
jgi:hypothetical protein